MVHTRQVIRDPRRPQRGMTLAELLIVISIITIGATLILPVVVNLARTQRVKAGTRVVQAMLHGARSLASKQRRDHGLYLFVQAEAGVDSAQRHYACLISTDDAGTAAENQKEEVLPAGLRVRIYWADNPSTPRPMPSTIMFRSDGTVHSDIVTPVRIELVNRDDEGDYCIITVRRTGVIEVQD